MCVFFVPYHDTSALFLIRGSYLNKKLRKEKFQFWWLRHNSSRILSTLTIFVMLFWKKLFFSEVIVSVNRRRKDIKVTFVFFSFHSGRFPVIYKEYGNKLFSYFDIFIYVSSNFTLDSRIIKYLQGRIGLQFHTSFINFDLVIFQEN